MPDTLWRNSFSCPKCHRENFLPWIITFLLTFISFTTIVPLYYLIDYLPIKISSIVFGLVAMILVVVTLRFLLCMYIRFSKSPILHE
jgi:hypothetical protein